MSNIITKGFDTFPKQQISDSAKTEKWFKDHLDVARDLMNFSEETGIRESVKNKYINYQLANNILSKEDMQTIVNPNNLKGFEFPKDLTNFPLVNPKIDLLVGESIKRLFNPIVLAVNSDAISDKEEMIKNAYLEFLSNKVMEENQDEEKIKAELEKLNKWSKWTAQDLRERMVQQIIEYHNHYQKFPIIFKNGMKDLLIAGEEMYRCFVKGGEPTIERMNPLEVITLRMGSSYKIQDSDTIIHRRRLSIGQIYDEFYDDLSPSQAKRLENGLQGSATSTGLWARPQTISPTFNINNYIEQVGADNVFKPNQDGIDLFGGAYDDEGHVLVTTIYWKSRRKQGKLTYYDEFGELTTKFVTENYEPNYDYGEKVEWFWINEWCEATRIADDIDVRMRVWPYNSYGIDNGILKTHPIIGVVANTNSNKSFSMYDRAKPYQYLYNAFMYNTKKLFKNNKGKVAVIDTAFIPDSFAGSPDKFLFYLEEMNIMWTDSFKEGNKGASLGKMAGNQSSQQRELNLENGAAIQSNMMMLNYLRSMVGEITGVSDARQGQIETRELVGNVEREVVQSSHITEEWFMLHDEVRLDAISMFVEIAKQCYKGKKERRTYILDDMSSAVLDIDGDLLNEAEYGLFIENASSANDVMQNLQGLAKMWAQNDKLSISQASMLFNTKSPSVLTRKFEEYEEEFKKREDAARQEQIKSNEAMAAQAAQIESEKLRIEEEKNIRDDKTKRYIAELGIDNNTMNQDTNDNGIKDELDREKLRLQQQKLQIDKELKSKQLEETKRSNLAKEQIAKSKPSTSNK